MANHGPVYGLDADLKAKQDSKYDSQIEGETRAWVEAVTGEKITNFHDDLKDGVTLCNLMNKIRPGLVKKINKQKTPFMMMENIGFFLKGCAALGVNKVDQFMTVDLYEAKNLGQVIHCIHALGRHVSNSSSYSGPLLGTSEVPRSSSTVTSPVKASNDDAERAEREAREAKEREEKARQEQEKREQEERAERERKEAEARKVQEAQEREEKEKELQAAKEREAQEKKEQEERQQREKIEHEKQEHAAREAQAIKEQEERDALLREAKAREEEAERKEKELQEAQKAKELQERIEHAEALTKQAVLVTGDQGPISQAQLQGLLNRLETLESAKSQIESKVAILETESKDLKHQLHEQTELNSELTKTVASLNKILEDLK